MPDNEKLDIIECPNCHAQYLPVEIFIPDAFFGKPVHIERDAQRKIIDIIGPYTNPYEHYICDYCNKPFKVHAKIQFNTKSEVKFDFDADYSTKLKKESLFLNEEDD